MACPPRSRVVAHDGKRRERSLIAAPDCISPGVRMALGPSTTGSERAAALSRMVAALEAAKKARDSGHNVQQVRGMLKAARSAFEAGDYTTAARVADQVLDTCGGQAVRAAGGAPRAGVLERISAGPRPTEKSKRPGVKRRP